MITFRLTLIAAFLVLNIGSTSDNQPKIIPFHKIIEIPGEGIKMNAYLYLPEGKGPFPAIISLPGGRGPKMIGKVQSFSKNIGVQMAKRGIATLLLDYSISNRTFLDPRRIQDIGAAVDFLKKNDSIQKQNIFLVGFSMGGANALRVSGTRNDIAGLVCYFTPNDWRIRKMSLPLKIEKQPVDYCADISCPVLILHGDKDAVTEIQQGQHLYDTLMALDKNVKLVIYEGAGHGFTYQGMKSRRLAYDPDIATKSFDEVEKFIKAHIK